MSVTTVRYTTTTAVAIHLTLHAGFTVQVIADVDDAPTPADDASVLSLGNVPLPSEAACLFWNRGLLQLASTLIEQLDYSRGDLLERPVLRPADIRLIHRFEAWLIGLQYDVKVVKVFIWLLGRLVCVLSVSPEGRSHA